MSSYKKHHTVKFEISSTAQDGVNFASEPFEGRVTVVDTVREFGFLDLLQPGDEVMAAVFPLLGFFRVLKIDSGARVFSWFFQFSKISGFVG